VRPAAEVMSSRGGLVRCRWAEASPQDVLYHDTEMQAVGMVDDHVIRCFRHAEVVR
jgi:3-methyladenine DNA glycosylase Tag